MAKDSNSEILTASELTAKAAKKELGKTLDYSIHSLKDLDALIQHVKNHFLNLKREEKLTEQIIQRASISIGAYLGEVIRRHHGGTWIVKNDIMKALVINGQEFSPILYIFQRLTKDLDYSLENYWSDIHKKLYPQEKIEDNLPVLETPQKTSLITVGIIGISVLCIVGILGITIYATATRIPPTLTPRPTATRIPATSTPSIIRGEPTDFLPNLPDGFDIDYSINQLDKTLDDGTRLFSIGFINRYALNHGDLVSVIYSLNFYPSEAKAVSEYREYMNTLQNNQNNEEGVLDSEIGIKGTDASAMYIYYGENNIAALQYTSRVKNVMVTTVGLTSYNPQTIPDSFLKAFMAEVAEFHILGIDKIH